ncbi:MAG: porin [Verrucomicrobiia bacterium]|jgi:phosphate-selective porin OprO/OprP
MKMRQRILVLMAVVATVVASTGRLFADDTNAAPAATVDDKINRLEQEIQDLKQQRELDQQQAQQQAQHAAVQAAQQAKSASIISTGPESFRFRSADSNFVVRIGGYAQADGRFYLGDRANNGVDTFLMRRVRPILEGTFYQDFDFRIMTDFGNGAAASSLLQDAYLEWHHWSWLKIRAGKFKPPVGLEQLMSDTDLIFMERGLPTDLVPQRDVGVQVSGDLLDGTVNYAGGVFNELVDGAIGDLDTGDAKDAAGRIFIQPFKTTEISPLQGFGFGAAGTIGDHTFTSSTTNLPTYKTTGQLTFFSYRSGVADDGTELRGTPQAYYYYGPFNLLGEYAVSEQEVRTGTYRDNLHNSAWQVEGGFFLTGEEARYRGSPYNPAYALTPRHPFNLAAGGWGAFEIAARYGELRIDPDAFSHFADPTKSAQEAREWGVGINWYPNRNVKLSLDYEQTVFDGGAGTTTAPNNRETEEDMFGRVQLQF